MKKLIGILGLTILFGASVNSDSIRTENVFADVLTAIHNLGKQEKSVLKLALTVEGPQDSFELYPTIRKDTLRDILSVTYTYEPNKKSTSKHILNKKALDNVIKLLQQTFENVWPPSMDQTKVPLDPQFNKLKVDLRAALEE